MPIYDAQSIPEKVYSSTKDPEIAEWLKTAGSRRPQVHSCPAPRA
jgi:hypothetical protein